MGTDPWGVAPHLRVLWSRRRMDRCRAASPTASTCSSGCRTRPQWRLRPPQPVNLERGARRDTARWGTPAGGCSLDGMTGLRRRTGLTWRVRL